MVRVTIQDNPVKHLHDNTDIWSLQGSPNGPRYQRDILVNVVPHNHDLATRPVFKDYNAGPHRTRQWWISYSKMQPLPFLVQHEVPTSIQLRTCVAFWINAYVREILPSNKYGGQLGQNYTAISRFVGKYQQIMMSRTRTVQDNLVKHIHDNTGRYYLYDGVPFTAPRSWEIARFLTGSF